ncbi:hypothetical protein SAMN02745216_02400 [Desulfatibacillum alkenivorans DSM 16219]|jgi:hypothetical protein|uniref:Glycosyltransferase RgtA/B/C/D-like domain-containing protein n=1 Tax=Desulfatibacillum alkenivorans DSM 16219 TaxID=1121393 RepID=A0A1M6MQ52_9BACT|nr:hypothetical protein [Desulfatibacillum alkenivorans]SHJ85645.1 hypothetical protein SAMN02745216_02400 [Desulfatibacillum alkenivorans DSM 16219]
MLPANSWVRVLGFWTLIGLTAWFAHFSLSGDFLLYEDDYAKVVDAMARNFDESVYNFYCHCRDWPQGRPLGFALIAPFSYIGVKLGGLPGVYITGYLMLLANAALFFLLVRKFAGQNAAVLGTLAFCLFPAVTVKAWATHFMGNEPALFFMLAAFLLYLSPHRRWSYLLIFLAAITYESTLLPFAAAPLLDQKSEERLARRLLRHGAALAVLLAVYCIIRMNLGEPRMTRQLASMGLGQISFKALTAMVIGPWTILKSFSILPLLNSGAFSMSGIISMALIFLCSLVVLVWWTEREDRPFAIPWNKIVPAFVLLALSYPMAFFPPHWPPVALAGTASRVHFAAAFGGSMAAGIILAYLFELAAHKAKTAVFVVFASCCFALLGGFHLSVQQDYAKSARLQKEFWTQVLALCPDMGENAVIFAEQPLWDHPGLMSVHSWATRLVLEKLIRFPKEWENPPQLYCMDQWVKDHVFQEPDKIVWREIIYGEVFRPHTLEPENVIVLGRDESGDMVRRFGVYRLGPDNQVLLDLKPKGPPSLNMHSRGPAWEYVIGERPNSKLMEQSNDE